MRGDDHSGTGLRALLERVESGEPTDAVEAVAAELAVMVGARAVSFLIADFSGRALVRFGPAYATTGQDCRQGTVQAETLELAGTVYDRVLRTQQVDVRECDGGAELIVPVTDRGDAIGVLELSLPRVPDDRTITDVAATAHALAYVVIANRRHTDLFEWGQRTTLFSLAAEIQRRLLPASYTCEAGQFTLAGWLEPSSSVGGDTFDYNLDRDVLQLSITDAVGHEVQAALLATLLVASLRNGRRRGLSLAEQASGANDDLAANTEAGNFVTGQLLRIDLHSGAATIINAGHPLPLRLRHGRVEEIHLHIDLPFGLQPGRSFRVQQFPLEPGDRLVFVTDGMLERNAARLDVSTALGKSGDLHPREVVHELGAAVLRATAGDLRDDATVLVLDWYGGGPLRRRVSTAGASRHYASPEPSPGVTAPLP
jgi:serine phosphatase RsbU (regulator of sigma subunit)